MKVEIKRFNIRKNPLNEVTSEKIFKPRRCKDANGNWRFNEKGIFSKEIFGEFNRCTCGATTTPGKWCPECGCRVISKSKIPDFYIPCDVRTPFINADFSVFGDQAQDVENLLRYKAFVYNKEVREADLEKNDLSDVVESEVFIGIDAVKELGIAISDKWIAKNLISDIPVPHPIYRPIIELSNGYVVGSLNGLLVEVLAKRNQILSFKKFNSDSKLKELVMSRMLSEKYDEIMMGMFDLLVGGKKSFMRQEIIAQSITGAIRAVVTSDASLPEDNIVISSEFAETLFPAVYSKAGGNICKMNKLIEKGNYHVLVNRPPTIGEKSIIAMKPIFSIPKEDIENEEYKVEAQQESYVKGKNFVVTMNPVAMAGLSGDFDGDVLLVIALYSFKANKEAENRLPSRIFINPSDGEIRNDIPEDFMFALKNILKEE